MKFADNYYEMVMSNDLKDWICVGCHRMDFTIICRGCINRRRK